MEASLIFPHQLYEKNPVLKKSRRVYLYEDPLYFTQFNFHKQKLLLHRASMKSYAESWTKKGFEVKYLDFHKRKTMEDVFIFLAKEGVKELHYTDTTDYLLERRLSRFSKKYKISCKKYPSPNFLITPEEFQDAIGAKGKYFMANFYIHQRKRFQILVENGKEPVGGKWSFDQENRKRLPAKMKTPPVYIPSKNVHVREAYRYIEKHFPGNYGNVANFRYAVTHRDAEKMLDEFLLNRLRLFGDYEDAIVSNQSFLFHSVLTPSLNIGLLSPDQILNRTFEFHKEHKFPMNSLEGFVRQILGWREFMRGVYHLEGVNLRTSNFINSNRAIPKTFWKGETGIPPIDFTIKKILTNGYCHHIERLMVLGNFMHLCGFHPDEVYRWFMELFIDSYDWVMVSNVYGMSQYACGNIMTTKPYISGSNYILKMSDYKKGDWCRIWDALYWRYLIIHREVFEENQRMKMMYNLLSKMPHKKQNEHLDIAENYLMSL
jgi:deoxyribodipyrimidine photolyase-related protein